MDIACLTSKLRQPDQFKLRWRARAVNTQMHKEYLVPSFHLLLLHHYYYCHSLRTSYRYVHEMRATTSYRDSTRLRTSRTTIRTMQGMLRTLHYSGLAPYKVDQSTILFPRPTCFALHQYHCNNPIKEQGLPMCQPRLRFDNT